MARRRDEVALLDERERQRGAGQREDPADGQDRVERANEGRAVGQEDALVAAANLVLEDRAVYRIYCTDGQWFLEGSYD